MITSTKSLQEEQCQQQTRWGRAVQGHIPYDVCLTVTVFVTLKRQLHDKVSAPSHQFHACARPCRQTSCMASRPAAGMQKPQLQGCRMTAAIGEFTRCPQKVHPGLVAASAKLVFERSILKPVWQAADRYTFPDISLLSATALLP